MRHGANVQKLRETLGCGRFCVFTATPGVGPGARRHDRRTAEIQDGGDRTRLFPRGAHRRGGRAPQLTQHRAKTLVRYPGLRMVRSHCGGHSLFGAEIDLLGSANQVVGVLAAWSLVGTLVDLPAPMCRPCAVRARIFAESGGTTWDRAGEESEESLGVVGQARFLLRFSPPRTTLQIPFPAH